MPKELLTRIDWSKIYPPLVEHFFELAAACRARGADFYAIAGYRTYAEQLALWSQGRMRPGKIVTNAGPGESLHNFGLAVDWCRDADMDRAGLQPDWNLKDYLVLAEEAEKLGLESALRWKNFKEGPHVQLRISSKSVQMSDLQREFKAGGLPAVWAFLDSKGPWF
jgi:peptidoglycan L-alanyl-D-glutamate endopeptidase CwlK